MKKNASKIRKIALLAVGDSAWQGGIQYIVNIVNALNNVSKSDGLEIVILKYPHQNLGDLSQFKNLKLIEKQIDITLPPFTLWYRVMWYLQRKIFGRLNPRYENYLLTNQFDFAFPALLSNCGGRLNVASWIADFQYHHFPEGHGKKASAEAEATIAAIVNYADKIVLSSDYCEKDAYRLFPKAKGKSFTMPFSVYINAHHLDNSLLGESRERYGIKGNYIMVSNLFAPTKNHKTLFEALGILKRQGIVIPCVCTGNFVNYARMEFTNDVLDMINNAGIRHQLFILGLIPRRYQIALYRMAVALVQPSINEGWSTLVEEAKALGKQLVASDIEVHREQFPNNVYEFNALDSLDLAKKLKNLWIEHSDKSFPDEAVEAISISNYQQKVKDFGERFLFIAAE